MQLLLQSMHKTCNSSITNPPQQMLLLRHGMLFNLLLQSCLGGFNVGALKVDNTVLPTGENAVCQDSGCGLRQCCTFCQISPRTRKEGTAKYLNQRVQWKQPAVLYWLKLLNLHINSRKQTQMMLGAPA